MLQDEIGRHLDALVSEQGEAAGGDMVNVIEVRRGIYEGKIGIGLNRKV